MAKLLHTMIRVRDLERSMAFYDGAFGMRPSHRLDFPDFSLVYLRADASDVEIELTWNRDSAEAYTHGTGYGHVAFAVDALDQEHLRLLALGWKPAPIKQLKAADGTALARFFFVEDPDGYRIEVLERAGHYQ